MIDFNNDGIITQDDVRLVLSHILNSSSVASDIAVDCGFKDMQKDSSQSLSTKDSNNSVSDDSSQTPSPKKQPVKTS